MNKLLFLIILICFCSCYHTDKETIQSLITVNQSLIDAKKIIEAKNRYIHSLFERSLAMDLRKVRPYYDRAARADHLSDSLVQLIQNLKVKLATEVGGMDKYADDSIEYMDNKDAVAKCNNILLDGTDAGARMIKASFIKCRKEMINMVYHKDSTFLKIGLLTTDNTNVNGESLSWEEYNFGHKSLIADIVTLTRLQLDVRNCEANIVAYLDNCVASGCGLTFLSIYFDRFVGGNMVASPEQLDSAERISFYPPTYASFDMEFVEKGKHIVLSSTNCLVTPEMHDEIKKLSKGDKVIIENVGLKAPDGYVKKYDGPTIFVE